MKEETTILWAIRIYALIIIAVLLISDFTSWIPADTVKSLIMLMAIFTITQSFQPYLTKHERARKWIMAGLIVLLLLGIIVFFIVQ
jgi:hypothetical protein